MAESNLKKESNGYGYKYTDLAQTHTYLESIGIRYYQYIERVGDDDYIYTVPIVDGEELPARRGCRVVQATLKGTNNPAQEQGSALTYARRYSLWLAFGLATTDDDAQLLSEQPKTNEQPKKNEAVEFAKLKEKTLKYLNEHNDKAGVEKFFSYYKIKDVNGLTEAICNDYLKKVEGK